MFTILISILAGVSIVLSRIINSKLGDKIGVFQSTFYNFLTGLLFSMVILFFSKETFIATGYALSSIPFVAFIGGFIGVIFITLSNYIAPKISTFYMTLLIFVGQLFVGIIIDYFTLNQLSIGKIIGGIVVSIGLAYNLMIDKQPQETNDECFSN